VCIGERVNGEEKDMGRDFRMAIGREGFLDLDEIGIMVRRETWEGILRRPHKGH
jgi:hypothetical protein